MQRSSNVMETATLAANKGIIFLCTWFRMCSQLHVGKARPLAATSKEIMTYLPLDNTNSGYVLISLYSEQTTYLVISDSLIIYCTSTSRGPSMNQAM